LNSFTNTRAKAPVEFINDIRKRRADAAIAEKLGVSRSYVETLIEGGLILVDGKTVKKSSRIGLGAHIYIEFPQESTPDITPKEIPFDILLNESDYAVIDKPSGIAVHPGAGCFTDTLVNGLLFKFQIDDETAGFRPGVVHRLDKDTSGLMIIAKNRRARELFSKLFAEWRIDKYYLCIAHGKIDKKEFVIDAPIGRDRFHRKRMGVIPNGRAARSEVKVLKEYERAFFAEVKLCTGRTHQIRVHFKHIKRPLMGDELYGGRRDFIARQALHSSRLAFTDPFNHKHVEITAELPADMRELLEKLV
jgi:23S rRNA pseudouridine1911/1915/1917 synthase